MLNISELHLEEERIYTDWLLANAQSSVYYAPIFHRFIRTAIGGNCVVLIAKEADRIVGALPYFERRHPQFGTVVNSLPWYGSYGGCFLADRDDRSVRSALLEKFAVMLEGKDLLSATVILSPGEAEYGGAYEAILRPRVTDDRIGQVTELPESQSDPERALESILLQKTRNLGRKAHKQGFTEVLADEDWAWKFLFDTHVDNMRAVGGKSKPWEHFQAIRSVFPSAMRRLSIAMLGRVPVAAMLLFLFNRTVEYITPVIVHDYRSLQPLSFLIWEGMLAAMKSGYSVWNWGGTWLSQKSLHHFKAGWGSTDMPYSYLVLADDRGVEQIKAARDEVSAAFPYHYVYPFSQLT